jgi:hypothetical protein
VCVTPGCIHDKGTGIFADSFGKGLGPMFYDDVTPAYFAGKRGVEGWTAWCVPVFELRNNDFCLKAGLALKNEQIHKHVLTISLLTYLHFVL